MIKRLQSGLCVYGVQYSPDGTRLAVGTWEGVELRDAATFALLGFFSGESRNVAGPPIFSSNGRFVAAAMLGPKDSTSADIWVWDTKTRRAVKRIKWREASKSSVLAFGSGNKLVAYGYEIVRAWNITSGHEHLPRMSLCHTAYHELRGEGYEISSDGLLLAVCVSPRRVEVWNTQSKQKLKAISIDQEGGPVIFCGFSYSGDVLITVLDGGSILLWEIRTGRLICTLMAGPETISGVAITPSEKQLVVSFCTSTLQLWDIESAQIVQTKIGSTDGNGVRCVVYHAESGLLTSGHLDHVLRLWNLGLERVSHTLVGHTDQVLAVAISRDGRFIASGSQDGTARIWSSTTGRELCSLSNRGHSVRAIAFGPKDKVLATASYDGILRFWEPRTGRSLGASSFAMLKPQCMAFNSEGNLLAVGFPNGEIGVWRNDCDHMNRILLGRTANCVNRIALTPTGDLVASASIGRGITLWKVDEGKLLHTFHEEATCLELTSSGDLLAGTPDGRLMRWDTRTGASTSVWDLGPTLTACTSLPDGKVVVGFLDSALIIWGDPPSDNAK